MTSGKPNRYNNDFQGARLSGCRPWVCRVLMGAMVVWTVPLHAQDVTLMDRIEVVVGDRLVTHSDIALERELLARGGGIMADLYAGMNVRDALVDATVLRSLASDLAMYQPESEQVLERLETIKETWIEPAAYADFLVSHGLTESRLEGILYSRLVVEQYIERNAPDLNGPKETTRAAYHEWMAERRSRLVVRTINPESTTPKPAAP